MDKLLFGTIAHAWIVFPALIAAVVAIMLRKGRPRRWYGWIGQATGAVTVLLLSVLLYACVGLVSAVKNRVGSTSFVRRGDTRVHHLDEFRGKVVLLNYWATWCPPCRAEMPALNQLADRYRDKGVVVLTVSDEPWERIDRFTSRFPMSTEVGQFRSAPPQGALDAFAYQGRPMTLILDREGRVAKLLIGTGDYKAFEEAVREFL